MTLCNEPFVGIDFLSLQASPKEKLRSQLFTVAGRVICAQDMVYLSSWRVFLIDTNDFSTTAEIDLSKNPTAASNEILIYANVLNYGLYMFSFQIKGTLKESSKIYTQNTYIKIIPTGLAIFGLENGVSCTSIGFKQTFVLNPAAFSIDFDYIASFQTLKFDFFCRKIFKNQINKNASLQYLNDDSASINLFSCFNSTGKCF